MTGNRKGLFAGFIAVIVASCLMLTLSSIAFAQAKSGAAPTFTAADAKALKSTDPDAVGAVLSKLVQINSAKGKDALKPAVDPLIECAWRELRLPPEKQWNLMDALKVISLTGDLRAKPLLLHVMSAIRGGGNPYTAQGLLLMGPAVVKDLADSLQSKSSDTKGRAALTLDKIAQYDKTGKFFSAQDRTLIKSLLVANVKDTNVGVRISTVSALGTFGDASVIPTLEKVEKTDAHKDSGGVYEVRVMATEALKKLRAK